jgi:hypothetical protein
MGLSLCGRISFFSFYYFWFNLDNRNREYSLVHVIGRGDTCSMEKLILFGFIEVSEKEFDFHNTSLSLE